MRYDVAWQHEIIRSAKSCLEFLLMRWRGQPEMDITRAEDSQGAPTGSRELYITMHTSK